MIDRSVAALASELVQKQIEDVPDHPNESAYRAACEGLPILLRTAGLARTVVFLDAKKKDVQGIVLKDLERQLEYHGIYSDPKQRKLNLLPLVTSRDLPASAYRHMSSLAFRVAYWHKRLAQALLLTKSEKRLAGEKQT